MRGAREIIRGIKHEIRIIPADAGSTCQGSSNAKEYRDHPRGCGEHPTTFSRTLYDEGSSPRMRGARPVCRARGFDPGIIPADAGSTHSSASFAQSRRDHPRGCGEHHPVAGIIDQIEGSSPRMRGAQSRIMSAVGLLRIIPADAGSTIRCRNPSASSPDHPRGCGEHSMGAICCSAMAGSSPRMRGAHICHLPVFDQLGIIPADAGSTDYGLWLAGGW